MARLSERYTLDDEPVYIGHTTHERTPYVSNTGDSAVILDVKKWPADEGITIQPGCTLPLLNPQPPSDATPIFASAPSGKGEVDVAYLK